MVLLQLIIYVARLTMTSASTLAFPLVTCTNMCRDFDCVDGEGGRVYGITCLTLWHDMSHHITPRHTAPKLIWFWAILGLMGITSYAGSSFRPLLNLTLGHRVLSTSFNLSETKLLQDLLSCCSLLSSILSLTFQGGISYTQDEEATEEGQW